MWFCFGMSGWLDSVGFGRNFFLLLLIGLLHKQKIVISGVYLSCYPRFGKNKKLLDTKVTLRTRHSLFSQINQGIALSKSVHAKYREVSVYVLYSTYVFIDCFKLNINMTINSLNSWTFSFPFMHVLLCPGDLSGGPKKSQTPMLQLTYSSWQGTGTREFPVLLTQWASCSSTGQWFWRASIVLAHQV